MFEGFEGTGDRQSRRRFAASSGLSIGIGGLIVVALIALASRPRERRETPPPVEVTFRAPVKAKPPPPPPPSPPPRPKRVAAKAARKAAGPSAAPTQRPSGALPEADAASFQAGSFSGIAWGEEAMSGLGGDGRGGARAPIQKEIALPRGAAARPVEEAERAVQPRPRAGNPLPAYPDAMRKKGVEALVILRVLIDEDGRVAEVEVVQGDEPFAAAAAEVVRSWRYQPGTVEGRPTAMHRLIRVPFRLRA